MNIKTIPQPSRKPKKPRIGNGARFARQGKEVSCHGEGSPLRLPSFARTETSRTNSCISQ